MQEYAAVAKDPSTSLKRGGWHSSPMGWVYNQDNHLLLLRD